MTTALDWPQRTESVRWRLYDVDDNLLGDLMVSEDRVPSITNDTTRSIRRDVSELTIPQRPLSDRDPTHYYADDVDTLTQSVRPWWQISTGGTITEYPLGKFVWGDDSSAVWSYGEPRTSRLTDLCTVLDQPIDDSIGYGAGINVMTAIQDVLDALNLTTSAVWASDTSAVFGAAVGWVAGRDTYLTVLDALFKVAGFLPPYFDNTGALALRAAPDIASATPEFTYGMGTSVIPGSAVKSNDLLTAPNRYVAIGSNTKQEWVGIFDVPDDAPNSYARIKRYRRKTENVQGINDQAQANASAAALYASDISTYTWLSFDARVDPRHDTWNIVSFDDMNYREVGWKIDCVAGGKMHHALRGAYQ